MSLKSFHIIFIVIAMLLCIGVAMWALVFTTQEDFAVTLMGIASAVFAAVLFVYGILFLRKSRKVLN